MKRKSTRQSTDKKELALSPSEKEEKARRVRLRKRRFLRIGQVVMLVGFLVALSHWLGHVGMFGPQPSLLWDVIAGYPTGAGLLIVGAITAGQK